MLESCRATKVDSRSSLGTFFTHTPNTIDSFEFLRTAESFHWNHSFDLGLPLLWVYTKHFRYALCVFLWHLYMRGCFA